MFAKRALALVLALALSGCIERKLIVKTDPPEADVEVDGIEIGRGKAQEPVFVKFEHYGIRRIVARAPGRKTREVIAILDPPWWQITPFDFITDVLLAPIPLSDERTFDVALEKRPETNRADAEAVEQRGRAVEREEKKP